MPEVADPTPPPWERDQGHDGRPERPETYARFRTGRRYDFQVMRAYREAMGLSPTPAARRRSRVRRAKP